MLPTECNFPDLSGLLAKPADRSFLVNQLVGAENAFPEKMLIYRRTFIRLSDKAARDYTDARTNILLLVERQKSRTLDIPDGRFLMHLIANKLEDAIITVRRLFNYFERIKSDGSRLPMDKLLKKKVDALQNVIREVRDLIVHMDEDISGGAIAAGQPIAPTLNITANTITVGKITLPAESLARAITHFHDFAHEFAGHQFLSNGTYEQIPKSGAAKS